MSYSYTEKRRIRKNFGRLPKVMELPRLIETQLDSYSQFLLPHDFHLLLSIRFAEL